MKKIWFLALTLLQSFPVFCEKYSFRLKSGAILSIITPEGTSFTECIHNPTITPEYSLSVYTHEQQHHYSQGSPVIIALGEFLEEFSSPANEPLDTYYASGFSLAALSTGAQFSNPYGASGLYPCLFKSCQVTSFKNPKVRNLHHKSDHKEAYEQLQNEKNIQCSICKRTFGSLLALLQHHGKIHFGLKLFD